MHQLLIISILSLMFIMLKDETLAHRQRIDHAVILLGSTLAPLDTNHFIENIALIPNALSPPLRLKF